MANICSEHMEETPVEGCVLCHSTPADLFGAESWAMAEADAEAAGEMDCPSCGFRFYRTTNLCPKCSRPWNDEGVRQIADARNRSRL